MTSPKQRDFLLEPADMERLANLNGPFDGHLRQIELRLGVEIANRGNIYRVTGGDDAVAAAEQLLHALYAEAGEHTLTPETIHLALSGAGADRV
ncbi:MAG: phosphate starvation-inducible protein PhoH, partial [Pseudomonadota bacterium]|nr:phosphate starvation-inducible protein PhoH [Pseudomonadota bacterium]